MLRYFVATRPGFLVVTLIGVLLGLATAFAASKHLAAVPAVLTLFAALLAHAGANVVNDYYDSRSGCDVLNTGRVAPFTGGSRCIQDGLLSEHGTGRFGYALLALVVPMGLWLAALSAPGLAWIGAAGLLAGLGYSAPPLRLQSRGLGEGSIIIAWLLVVIGTDFVQRHAFSFAPVAAGLGYALLVSNVLYINQFPDAAADAAAGKRTLVVRLGADRARWGYALVTLFAYGWMLAMIGCGRLPRLALCSLLPAVASLIALRQLMVHAGESARLRPAIRMTILAAVAHGLLLAGSLVLAGWVAGSPA